MKKRTSFYIVLVVAFGILIQCQKPPTKSTEKDELLAGFINPPQESKPTSC